MALDKKTKKISVIAHRGAAGLFPENTMSAFRKARNLGVDAIEIDVHASSDGIGVVIHDPDLNRLAGLDKLISEMSYKEISDVKILNGENIPDLESVLQGVEVPFFVELKVPEALEPVIRVLQGNPEYIKRCTIISFDHESLAVAKEKLPEISTGALLLDFPDDPCSVAESCGAETLCHYHKGLTKEYVDKCHECGLLVNVWTPNDVGEIRDAITSGVDSITTDRPDVVFEELRKYQIER